MLIIVKASGIKIIYNQYLPSVGYLPMIKFAFAVSNNLASYVPGTCIAYESVDFYGDIKKATVITWKTPKGFSYTRRRKMYGISYAVCTCCPWVQIEALCKSRYWSTKIEKQESSKSEDFHRASFAVLSYVLCTGYPR
jgi:hypothetical protein